MWGYNITSNKHTEKKFLTLAGIEPRNIESTKAHTCQGFEIKYNVLVPNSLPKSVFVVKIKVLWINQQDNSTQELRKSYVNLKKVVIRYENLKKFA